MHANLVYLVKRRLMPYVHTPIHSTRDDGCVCVQSKKKVNIHFYVHHSRYHNIIGAYKKHTLK